MGGIIKQERGIIVATDVADMKKFADLVQGVCDVEGVEAVKIGAALTIRYGLPALLEEVRGTGLKSILDLQKGGTDIPETGREILGAAKSTGLDAFIAFHMTGPASQERWITDAKEVGIGLISGLDMTHPKYRLSEGGYLSDSSFDDAYLLSARKGISNFVVPGNSPERIRHYHSLLETEVENISLYVPGFITQGGEITAAAKAAGESWYAIIGRAIYSSRDPHEAAKDLISQILKDR